MSSSGISNIEIPKFVFEDTASCLNTDPELFFPQEHEYSNGKIHNVYKNLAEAKKICETCPLRIKCLEYALKNAEYGIWGGTTEEQRQGLRRRVGISAPRRFKTPTKW